MLVYPTAAEPPTTAGEGMEWDVRPNLCQWSANAYWSFTTLVIFPSVFNKNAPANGSTGSASRLSLAGTRARTPPGMNTAMTPPMTALQQLDFNGTIHTSAIWFTSWNHLLLAGEGLEWDL